MSKKKLQIFISSTYTDLIEERQASVEAILGSRHMPAGMELFKAGNKSQLDTIKKWIDESDLYMLILGGRYGSIEPMTGKSYTQIEYEYAIDKNIPVFAVVLTDSYLYRKAALKQYDVFEKDNVEKYQKFKEFVMTKIVKHVDDCKDIQIAIKDSIVELENEYKLCGWIKASEVEDCTKIIKENNRLLKENQELKKQIDNINKADKIGNFKYEELKEVLKNKTFTIPKEYIGKEFDRDINTNYLKFFMTYKDSFITGIENQYGMNSFDEFIFFKVAPILISFGVLNLNKISGVKYRRLEMSKLGLEFSARLEIESLKQNKKIKK